MDANVPITDVLDAWADGDPTALNDLMEFVYTELHAAAEQAMAGERHSHTLQPTALVNEVYLQLRQLKRVSWENRAPFFAFASRLMRRILVEHARAAKAQKRGGELGRVTLETVQLPAEEPAIDPLILDDTLQKIEAVDARLVRIIELKFFGGLTEEEIAASLRISRATVQREWVAARRLLAKFLG
jgi:RNA polymerase sigma factor (TIGR02999 family)